MEIPDAVEWCSKKLNFEFGSPHPPLNSYVNVYFTSRIDVSKSSYVFTQGPTEHICTKFSIYSICPKSIRPNYYYIYINTRRDANASRRNRASRIRGRKCTTILEFYDGDSSPHFRTRMRLHVSVLSSNKGYSYKGSPLRPRGNRATGIP